MLTRRALAATMLVAAVSLVAVACGGAEADDPVGQPPTTQPPTTEPPPTQPAEDRSSASFVGLSVDETGRRAAVQGRAWRVVTEDGVGLPVTADYVEDRLNLTVESGIVVAARTDAELVSPPAGSTCPDLATQLEAAGIEGRVLGSHDLDGDGSYEAFVLVLPESDPAEITMWAEGDDCAAVPITRDGTRVVLTVGVTPGLAAGATCRPQYADDLYLVDLLSGDGVTYEGRITAFNLEGTELVEASGEGAAYSADDVATVAVLSCGDVTYP